MQRRAVHEPPSSVASGYTPLLFFGRAVGWPLGQSWSGWPTASTSRNPLLITRTPRPNLSPGRMCAHTCIFPRCGIFEGPALDSRERATGWNLFAAVLASLAAVCVLNNARGCLSWHSTLEAYFQAIISSSLFLRYCSTQKFLVG